MKLPNLAEFVEEKMFDLYHLNWIDNTFLLKDIKSYFRRKNIVKQYKNYLFYKLNE